MLKTKFKKSEVKKCIIFFTSIELAILIFNLVFALSGGWLPNDIIFMRNDFSFKISDFIVFYNISLVLNLDLFYTSFITFCHLIPTFFSFLKLYKIFNLSMNENSISAKYFQGKDVLLKINPLYLIQEKFVS